jgi:membrane-associated protease RseP (regulator of RpoE activity)
MNTILLVVILSIFTAVSPASAGEPPPADAPAPQPADAERDKKIQALIKALGERDSKTWQPARDELRKLGKPALPQLNAALKKAEENRELLLRSRLSSLIRSIENPQAAAGGVRMGVGVIPGGGPAIPVPAVPPQGDTSLDLLDGFGARLGETAEGVRVTDLKANSPADRLGLLAGDIINKINGRQVANLEDARAMLAGEAGNKVTEAEVTRKQQTLTLTAPKP